MSQQPNIVLVHGAWGDAMHWRGVIPALQQAGHHVLGVENPLTSLPDDVDRTRTLVESLSGPTLLVGHSYGGSVITNAGHGDNVVGLVYIAGWAPDEGESLASLSEGGEPPPGAAHVAPDAQGYLWIAQDKFHESFCQDLDPTEALVLAATQKPLAGRCFGDVTGPPAWKVKPTWYQVSTQDRMIPPDVERFFAKRMGARQVLELDAGHASLASRPAEVAELILTAAREV
jgi:pimeloyl-ACP methyl ester carboxylesterase